MDAAVHGKKLTLKVGCWAEPTRTCITNEANSTGGPELGFRISGTDASPNPTFTTSQAPRIFGGVDKGWPRLYYDVHGGAMGDVDKL